MPSNNSVAVRTASFPTSARTVGTSAAWQELVNQLLSFPQPLLGAPIKHLAWRARGQGTENEVRSFISVFFPDRSAYTLSKGVSSLIARVAFHLLLLSAWVGRLPKLTCRLQITRCSKSLGLLGRPMMLGSNFDNLWTKDLYGNSPCPAPR